MVAIIGSLISFLIALLVGGLAIYISASAVVGVKNYSHAVVTALLGAIGWFIGSLIPVIGSVVALVVYLGVINWRYPGGWVKAAIIAIAAWLSALVILFLVNAVFGLGVGAFGVPGV